MTDRDRLIDKIDYLQKVFMEDDDYDHLSEFLADRLLADKDIIVPPCKVGDMIYTVGIFTGQIIPSEVVGIETTQNDMFLILANQTVVSVVYQLGKTVFLTKEEAESELRKRCEDNA